MDFFLELVSDVSFQCDLYCEQLFGRPVFSLVARQVFYYYRFFLCILPIILFYFLIQEIS